MKDFSDTEPTGFYEAAIGEKNQIYYLDKFEHFDQQGPGLKMSWNWAAFLGGGAWALYRKMYGWFAAWWFVATVVTVFAKAPNPQIHQALAIVVGVLWLGFAIFANSLYQRKVKARIATAQKSNADASRVARRLRASSGVHIWVPIVFAGIPAIAILAAVALPAYQDYAKRQVPAAKQTESAISPVAALPNWTQPVTDVAIEPTSNQRQLEDQEFLRAKGVGGKQDVGDVVAWGDAQLSARSINENNRQRAHKFAIQWQYQFETKIGHTPARALFFGYMTILNSFAEHRLLCRPDAARNDGGVADGGEGTIQVSPECFQM